MDSLIQAITLYTRDQAGPSPYATAVDGLTILRSDHANIPHHLIYRPALCMVVQGSKWTLFGGRHFEYHAGQALVVSVKMPALGRVVCATPEEPYLGLIIELDMPAMREVLEALDAPLGLDETPAGSVFVLDVPDQIVDCATRLIRLLDTPKAIPILHSAIMRELYYWLLTGAHGGAIAKLAMANGLTQRVVESVHQLRDRYAEPIRIEDLARSAAMSPSAFHQHFKALVGITPLQFQKQIRLLEARRLLMSSDMNVESAAAQVGYESPSQFSREYTRMFGASPRRDASVQLSVGVRR